MNERRVTDNCRWTGTCSSSVSIVHVRWYVQQVGQCEAVFYTLHWRHSPSTCTAPVSHCYMYLLVMTVAELLMLAGRVVDCWRWLLVQCFKPSSTQCSVVMTHHSSTHNLPTTTSRHARNNHLQAYVIAWRTAGHPAVCLFVCLHVCLIVCVPVCFHCRFWTDWHFTLIFACVCHDPSP